MSMTVLNAGHHYYVRAGAEAYLIALEALLKRHQHQVIPFAVADARNHATPWSSCFPPGVDVNHPRLSDVVRFLYSRSARQAMCRLLQHVSPDIAHLHLYYGQLTTSILAPLRQAGIPIVQSLHDYKLTCPVYTHTSHGQLCEACAGKHFWQAVRRRCNRGSLARSLASATEAYLSRALGDIRQIDHFIAVSDFMRRQMLAHGVLTPDKITTIHNFVDTSHFDVSHQEGKYVLYFGRIAPVKGLQTLIEAAAPLHHVPLYIVGEGSQRQALEAYVAQHGLQHVHFLGFKQGPDLHELIRHSICTVLPAEWYENCPMSVLESLALGRPVIGADIGGIPELIKEQEDGFLVPSGHVERLREKLLWMTQHTKQAVEMGQAGRRKVEATFSPQVHYEQLMRVYKTFL